MGNIPNKPERPVIPIEQKADAQADMFAKNIKAKNEMKFNQKITSDVVREATQRLFKFKEGKARLEQRIINNEEFFKLNQWKFISHAEDEFTPATAWLWLSILSRYSDAMDAFPTCNIKPRQRDDREESKILSSVLPVIMEQNRYEETFSDIVWYTLKQGGSVQGVFWDAKKNNGLGDITIKQIDFLNLFWQPGIKDIQDSSDVFLTELVDNKILLQRYPQLEGHLGGDTITVAKYVYDENIDTIDKSVVVDWYYHTEYNGERKLHYCKFVNDVVLYATENDTVPPTKTMIDPDTSMPVELPIGESMSSTGLYNHAKYPFVVMKLYPVEGSICGYGLIDIAKDTQMILDIFNKNMTEATDDGTNPRYFFREGCGVNEEEYLDKNKKIVHVTGSLNNDNVMPIQTKSIDSSFINFYQMKIEEMNKITSNQDVNNGSNPTGVTAASAIVALQETAGKNSRSSNMAFYRAYRDVCYQVIELIRQFYDVPRTFRIAPDSMEDEDFVSYSNEGLKPQPQIYGGQMLGYRLPEFDIDVTAEKKSPYKKMEINELALQLYQLGFFNPDNADQSLACLSVMDFEHKDIITDKISENQTLKERLLQFEQLALQLASASNPQLAKQIADVILAENGQPTMQTSNSEVDLDSNGESKQMTNSREMARESTQIG